MSKILNAINIGGEKYVFGGSVEGDFYRNSPTLSAVPDASTLTDTSGNAFDIGQTVRVPASVAEVSDSVTGYIFYRLAAIDGNNRAIWEQLDEGTVEIPETVTVHIASNLSTTDDLIGVAQVTVDGVTKTYQGEDLIFYVDEGTQYTISSNTPNGYAVSNNSTGTYTAQFWGSREATITYNTEIVTVTTSMNGVTLTIDGVTYTEPVKIAYGTSYTVSGSAVDGYKVSSETITASQVSRTVIVAYEELKTGVYVIDANGNEVDAAQGDSSYIGVVVRDADKGIAFILDKNTKQKNSIRWSNNNYGSNAAGITEFSDYDGNATSTFSIESSVVLTKVFGYYNNGETGVANTNIIKAFDSTESDNAALYCYNRTKTINGQTVHGYLGTVAEWYVLSSNISAVNTALSKIGGTQFDNNYWWTSAESSTDYAWFWGYYTGSPYFTYYNKDASGSDYYAVPFFPVP